MLKKKKARIVAITHKLDTRRLLPSDAKAAVEEFVRCFLKSTKHEAWHDHVTHIIALKKKIHEDDAYALRHLNQIALPIFREFGIRTW